MNPKIIRPLTVTAAAFMAAIFLNGCSVAMRPGTPLPTGGSPEPGAQRDSLASADGLPALEDELWVISRNSREAAPADDEGPGSGAMVASVSEDEKEVPLPLKHTDVKASISGYIATVQVTQQFHNPYDEKIEAVYVFPLPHNAAVNEFIMTIGQRRIRGIIREREEAERIYRAARRQGHVASLLTQERPNIFKQSVANIEPGREIDVNIKYFHTLAYDDGWYEFVFPMVVGPRFNPPGTTDGIGAVGRSARGKSGQRTEVHYLKPNERSGHDISLTATVDAGVAVEEVLCRTHVIEKTSDSRERFTVSLSPNDRIPNKDFVLRYRVAGERIKTSLMTSQDARGGFFTLMLYPPKELTRLRRKPLEMVFVLDCSGSMHGWPIEQAKNAIRRSLHQLEPDDTFQITRFSEQASQIGNAPLAATPRNIERGLRFVDSLDSQGGTMMIQGIQAALNFPHDPDRLRFVVFLTDGYIGNEKEILVEVQKRLGASRIFSFGVGSSVNRFLLERMAKLGRGAVAYLGPNDNAREVMDYFFARTAHPALTDIEIDWGASGVSDIFPANVPDLFVGRPVIVSGRMEPGSRLRPRITGQAGGRSVTLPADALRGGQRDSPALPSVWARMKLAELSDQMLLARDSELRGQIQQLALDYGLMSAYTAFVAVDSSRRTKGTEGTTVPVAVPVPEGVRYRTTVDD